MRTNGSGIVASVARIDHDSTNLQSQRANERPRTTSCGLCLSHVEFRRQIASFASRRPTGSGMNRAVSTGIRYARHDKARWRGPGIVAFVIGFHYFFHRQRFGFRQTG